MTSLELVRAKQSWEGRVCCKRVVDDLCRSGENLGHLSLEIVAFSVPEWYNKVKTIYGGLMKPEYTNLLRGVVFKII